MKTNNTKLNTKLFILQLKVFFLKMTLYSW